MVEEDGPLSALWCVWYIYVPRSLCTLVSSIQNVSVSQDSLHIEVQSMTDFALILKAQIDWVGRQLHAPSAACSTSQKKNIPIHYQVQSILGRPLSKQSVKFQVGPVQLQIGACHEKEIHLLVLEQAIIEIILGHP